MRLLKRIGRERSGGEGGGGGRGRGEREVGPLGGGKNSLFCNKKMALAMIYLRARVSLTSVRVNLYGTLRILHGYGTVK